MLGGLAWFDHHHFGKKRPHNLKVRIGPVGVLPLEKYGAVTEQTAGSVKLKVKRERVIPVCKALLDELPVTDIDIQEVPVEDIIRQIFVR